MDTTLLLEILKRLACAALCGACLGFERDVHGRAAGLRTHTLVAAGSALFAIVSFLYTDPESIMSGAKLFSADAARIAAQIVSGIGFLGAGTIVKGGFTVKGLTTAACLWFAAALGMACAINQILVALCATAGALAIVFLGKQLERKLHRLFPFQLVIESKSYDAIEKIRAEIISQEFFVLTTLNLSENKETSTIKASFFIDAEVPKEQVKACLFLVRHISENYPDVTAVSYKSEG